MKRFIKTLAATMLCVTAPLSAHADFVHTDWLTEGDEKATLHEETGIEWLKVDNTLGMSIDEVLAETGEGALYDGWRLPTAQEVLGYWEAIFEGSSVLDDPQGGRYTYSAYTPQAQGWVEFTGLSTSSPIRSYGMGYRLDGQVSFFGISRTSSSTSYWNGHEAYDEATVNQYAGVLLVSDGGVTLSSINDPMLNTNNANAPVNNVGAPLTGVALSMAGFLALSTRRKR
ncbi:hypothetical protein BM525_18930 (plasmid) [Alteromonas mediterranea]|uniref:DUF1566 domain-containing protein n=1 Tax=Alteromonas mediterranea TaxID=314275 RepID=A0AAC9JE16_9ALTE|nr:hypothetical protein [Alteromonas mediterranea]APD91958.1 hypothetical protein BM524_18735 [Alteromonas mediterranea]APD99812.1 hypothetical protein BM525_18930 [Alteromonas mediterranea]